MPSHVRQNVCDFHYLRENIYIFSTCKNSIITVVTYANWKLLVIGVKLLEHAMRIEWALNVHVKEAFIGLQCI